MRPPILHVDGVHDLIRSAEEMDLVASVWGSGEWRCLGFRARSGQRRNRRMKIATAQVTLEDRLRTDSVDSVERRVLGHASLRQTGQRQAASKSKTAIPAYGFRILSPYGRSTPGLVILQF